MSNGLSLKSLAEDLLNVSLDKSLELRCSDWEAERLTLQQVQVLQSDGSAGLTAASGSAAGWGSGGSRFRGSWF